MSFSAAKGEGDDRARIISLSGYFQTESEGEGTTEDKCMMIRTSMH